MKNTNEIELTKNASVERRELVISKRRVPKEAVYYKANRAWRYINGINQMIYFYCNFETRFEIKKGDVFLTNFQFQCGSELKDPHFCVALLNSSKINQIVFVVPLHSAKEGKELNPASEIFIGQIPGITNGKDAVAMINQIRAIDKRRLFDREEISNFNQYAKNKDIKDYDEITAQHKFIYRLTDEQFEKIHIAVQQFLYNGFISIR